MIPSVTEFTDVQLCTYDGDMNHSWFVYFDFTDHSLGITARKQYRGGINYYHNKEDRLRHGNALKKFYQQKLEGGWNPLSKETNKPSDTKTLEDLIPEMMKVKVLKPKSRATYEDITNTFMMWCKSKGYQKMHPSKFVDTMAQSYLDYLTGTRLVGPKTHNNHRTVIKGHFAALKKRKYIKDNPFEDTTMLKEGIGKNVAFTKEEQEKLKELLFANNRGLYNFTQFMYYTFIRRTELLGLKIENIDFEAETIFIPENVSKNNKAESVVFPKPMLLLLKRMALDTYPSHYYIFGHGLVPGPKRIIRADNVTDAHTAFIRPKERKEGQLYISEEKTLYSWKHSGVVAAYKATKDLYAIMRQCRHYDVSVTQKYLKSLGLVENTVIKNAIF